MMNGDRSSERGDLEARLHPKETDYESFGYTLGQCPNAEKLARETVNLPVHPRVGEFDLVRTLEFFKRFAVPAEE